MARVSLRSTLLAGAFALCVAPASAQVLEAAIDQSPAGLDPHIITAFASFMVVNGTIYEGLTAIDKDLRVQPGIAESWTVAPDGKTYTFKLRSGATFHNGAPVEAADVVSSLKRVLSKDIASPLASRLAAVDTINAPDASTVELKLKEPAAPLLTSLATLAIVPRGFEADKDSLQKQPVGTGPFKFKDWQPNGFIQLARHEGYWKKGAPKLEGVKFNIVPESATRQVGVSSGQYAMLPNIDAATALQLKGKPNVKLAETLELAYSLVGMNVSRPPFDNAKVREALNTAINRDEIVAAALFGAGVPGGPLSPALKDWAVDVKEFPCYKSDPAKAQELLKAAGVQTPVAVTMIVLPRQDIKDIAQVVQQQLNKAGFKVELKTPELGQFIQDWRNSNFDLFASTNAGSPDPDDYFYRTFRTGGSTNVFKYSNPEVDTLLDRARATTDTAARKADYAKVQKTLACEGPIAHLTYGQLFTALRSNVQGFEIIANRSLSSLADVSVLK
ncbi:ABC transporter substrate-binding protein [Alsobacter sp. SYSU M60028]|uniref:ABC transporter substrate-binding protein n=1 Tax=Alsobacter ponti TaxID=2962936 RepID=A0ABT1L6E3_9HYPH|nr:ABC transporter substrate-binding protein [Alsobacter ponti]MCP8936962.1 ABC transporter substrate-binding protein [Alsobacter ponti]